MLADHSCLPYMIEIALLLGLVSTPLFRAADSALIPAKRAVANIEGLRGFLALGVFFHHAAIYHDGLLTGQWLSSVSRFYMLLGPASVAVFFMITGYLFYAQLLSSRGRPDWRKLYIGRVFRILPLYWFAMGLVLVRVFEKTGFHLRVPATQLGWELFRWSTGGLFSHGSINGYSGQAIMLLDLSWTLRFEWLFYLSLILLAFVIRSRIAGLVFPVAALLFLFLHELLSPQPTLAILAALFAVGMSAAAFRAAKPDLKIQGPVASLVVAALLVTSVTAMRSIYTPLTVILLGAAFLLITSGTSVFGLLSSYPAKRLGAASYGIYLLQEFVVRGTMQFSYLRSLDLRSTPGHFAVLTLQAVLLVIVATCAFVWIERPSIQLGRRIAARFTGTQFPGSTPAPRPSSTLPDSSERVPAGAFAQYRTAYPSGYSGRDS